VWEHLPFDAQWHSATNLPVYRAMIQAFVEWRAQTRFELTEVGVEVDVDGSCRTAETFACAAGSIDSNATRPAGWSSSTSRPARHRSVRTTPSSTPGSYTRLDHGFGTPADTSQLGRAAGRRPY